MSSVLIVAAYRFVDLDDADALRQAFAASATHAGLKGTIVLATEGINLALAGAPPALQGWMATLQTDPRFAELDAKWHTADKLPFGRLRVKRKPEIIRMNQPAVRPGGGRAPSLDAATLARWLARGHCDAGRPLRLLDTRNAFEVAAGAFEGAVDWQLGKFSNFPAALQAHAAQLEGATVVSYCTGGIRCEKAALWMAHTGLPHVLQLEGGILRYFEQLPDAPHWQGRCVVFDEREAVSPSDTEVAA